MIRLFLLLVLPVGLCLSACGKRGDLSLPPGVETLPNDPSKRGDPPA